MPGPCKPNRRGRAVIGDDGVVEIDARIPSFDRATFGVEKKQALAAVCIPEITNPVLTRRYGGDPGPVRPSGY